MNSKDIWNIVIKVNKKVIKINVSVFFFIFIPYVYYLDKGSSNLYINFFKNYVKTLYNFIVIKYNNQRNLLHCTKVMKWKTRKKLIKRRKLQ